MNTIKSWVWAVITAVFGFTIGLFVRTPNADGNLAGGDISKVSKFQKNTVSSEMSAFQERMLNNPDELNAQVTSLIVLNSRLTDFDNLISLTEKVAQNRSELSEPADDLKILANLSENARQSSHDALASFDQLLDKNNKGGIAYDQATQNATLGFLKIERQVSSGKKFVLAADEYLKKNGVKGNEDLALVRDLWQDFCQVDAIMNSDKEEATYWASIDKSLNTLGDVTGACQVRALESSQEMIKSFEGTQAVNLAIVQTGLDVLGNIAPSITPILGFGVSPMEALNFSSGSFQTLSALEVFQVLQAAPSQVALDANARSAALEAGARSAALEVGARSAALEAGARSAALEAGTRSAALGIAMNLSKLEAILPIETVNAVSSFGAQLNGSFSSFGQLSDMVSGMTEALGNASSLLIPAK